MAVLPQQQKLYDLSVASRQAQEQAVRDDLARQVKNLELATAWEQEDLARNRDTALKRLPTELQGIGSQFAARGSYDSGAREGAQIDYRTDLQRQLDEAFRTADRSGHQRYLQVQGLNAEAQQKLAELARQGQAGELEWQLGQMQAASGGGGGGGRGGGGYRSSGGGSSKTPTYGLVFGTDQHGNPAVLGTARAAGFSPEQSASLRGGKTYNWAKQILPGFLAQTGGKGTDRQAFDYAVAHLAKGNGWTKAQARAYLLKAPQQLSQALADARRG